MPDRFVIVKRAFIDSLPVLMGYSAMGFAAGVLLSAHSGIDFAGIWAFLTSATSISGALQFMLVDWIAKRTPLLDVALLTFCLNIRYAMYGFSLIDRFRGIGFWKKFYLIWSLTDETYALETECKIPEKKKKASTPTVISPFTRKSLMPHARSILKSRGSSFFTAMPQA